MASSAISILLKFPIENKKLPTFYQQKYVNNCNWKILWILKNFSDWKTLIFWEKGLSLQSQKWYHSSVGRAKDWKSLCPRFDSWWYHLQKSNACNPTVVGFIFYSNLQILPQLWLSLLSAIPIILPVFIDNRNHRNLSRNLFPIFSLTSLAQVIQLAINCCTIITKSVK